MSKLLSVRLKGWESQHRRCTFVDFFLNLPTPSQRLWLELGRRNRIRIRIRKLRNGLWINSLAPNLHRQSILPSRDLPLLRRDAHMSIATATSYSKGFTRRLERRLPRNSSRIQCVSYRTVSHLSVLISRKVSAGSTALRLSRI